jgi:hypothetical protein
VKISDKPCAYCGTTEIPCTKGHVIPRNLFPVEIRKDVQLITVPECESCKAIWEDAEPHFRNIFTAIWDPEVVIKDSRYRNMIRSFSKCDGNRRMDALFKEFKPASQPHTGREVIYPAKDPNVNLILRRIVRGLCHHHRLDTPINDSRVYCDYMPYKIPIDVCFEMTWHELYPNFFSYGFFYAKANYHSWWILRFSKHIEFFGFVSL